MARGLFLLACLFGLSGCGTMAVTLVAANMATLMHADKTIPDIVLSNQHGKNCSLLHAERNETYCQDSPPDPSETLAALADTRYCYRTLGSIDCYERPDFLASGHTRVNFATGYLPARNTPAPVALRQGQGSPMAGIPPPPAGPLSSPKTAAVAAPMAAPGPSSLAAPPAMALDSPPGRSPTAALIEAVKGAPHAQVPPLAALPGQGTY